MCLVQSYSGPGQGSVLAAGGGGDADYIQPLVTPDDPVTLMTPDDPVTLVPAALYAGQCQNGASESNSD